MRTTASLLIAVGLLIGTPCVAGAQIGEARQQPLVKSNDGGRIKKGAIIGLAVGAITFPTYEAVRQARVCDPVRGTIHACDDERSRGEIVLLCGSIGAAVGALVGAAVGAALGRRHSTSRLLPSRFAVGPIAGRERKGIAVAFAF